jgi:hypothetical protein
LGGFGGGVVGLGRNRVAGRLVDALNLDELITGLPSMSVSSHRQQAIALLNKLDDNQLPEAIAALEALRPPIERGERIEEEELVRRINERLSLVQQQRMELLRDRLEAETLTADEREELVTLAEAIEVQDAERARAMFELATLRGVDLAVIVQEFRAAIGRD